VTRRVLAGLLLVGGLLLSGCSDSPTCDDLESLTEELADTDVDDPDYNDLVSQANQAEADCNKDGGY
jgi:outer membrane murein-binding lipoprotein Lpp